MIHANPKQQNWRPLALTLLALFAIAGVFDYLHVQGGSGWLQGIAVLFIFAMVPVSGVLINRVLLVTSDDGSPLIAGPLRLLLAVILGLAFGVVMYHLFIELHQAFY
jgi:hypothetical protein